MTIADALKKADKWLLAVEASVLAHLRLFFATLSHESTAVESVVRGEAMLVLGEAKTLETQVVHQVEKEIAMTFDTQPISDALDRLKARPDQSATITALQGQVNDLTDKLAAANSDNAALVQDLTTIQAALLALTPDPNAAPAQ